MVEPGRLHMTIWRMRIACWMTRAANIHSEYVILIVFPLQQSLHERPSLLLSVRLHWRPTDTAQQSGQTVDKEVKNHTFYCVCQRLH